MTKPWKGNWEKLRGWKREVKEIKTVTSLYALHDVDKEPEKFTEFPVYEVFDDVIKLTQEELLAYLPSFLFGTGYYTPARSKLTKDYLYFEGTIPVLMIAHLDTVHKNKVSKIYQHVTEKYLIAKEGIGGDDRCGVYGILYMVVKGAVPYILFTTDEETGAKGARVAAKELVPSKDILFMVEIDRRGKEDSVYYDNDNKEFKKYIDSFGFKEATGSFSDISVLGDAWNIASVNISSGYYNAHSKDEKIKLWELVDNVKKIMSMFDKLPEKRFEHVEKKIQKYEYGGYYGGYYDDYYNAWGEYYTADRIKPSTIAASKLPSNISKIPLKHLKKAVACIRKIEALPFVKKVYVKEGDKKTTGAYFLPKGSDKTSWVADIIKRSGPFAKDLTPAMLNEIQPCISFLQGSYKMHDDFDTALDMYIMDPGKFSVTTQKTLFETTKKTGFPKDFDDLSSSEQRNMIYETMDCVEELMKLDFIKDVKINDDFFTMTVIGDNFTVSSRAEIMVKDKDSTFMKNLSNEYDDESVKAIVECVTRLSERLSTYKGFSKEIAKDVADLEEKSFKKPRGAKGSSEKASGVIPFKELPMREKEVLVETMFSRLELIANLDFVKNLKIEGTLNYIFLSYKVDESRVVHVTLEKAITSDDFIKNVKKQHVKDADNVLSWISDLVTFTIKHPGLMIALEKRANEHIAKIERETKPAEKKKDLDPASIDGMARRAIDVILDISMLRNKKNENIIKKLNFYSYQKNIGVEFVSGGIKIVDDIHGLYSRKTFVDEVTSKYPGSAKTIINSIKWLSDTIKAYPGMFPRIEVHFKASKEKEIGFTKKESEILSQVVERSKNKEDRDRFFDLWRASGHDMVKAFEEWIGVKMNIATRTENFFDDAPASRKASSRDIVDRFDQPEYINRSKTDPEDDYEKYDACKAIDDIPTLEIEEALDVLMDGFHTYHFIIDDNDIAASMFIDDEGVERPIFDLKTEISSMTNARTRRILKGALDVLIRYA